jgi:MFS family permease
MIERYFMFTYITTATVSSFSEIQQLFNISYSQVNLTVAIPSIGLALGPLFWSSLSDIYGRRVVFITGTTIALAATIGTAVTKNYSAYMAARAFQGFGVSPAGTVGMAIIGEQVQLEEFPRWMLTICL